MTTTLLSAPSFRRWALMLGSLLGTGAVAQAQTLNYSTTTATNVAGTYTDLGTTGAAISTANTDDANSAAQNIGFTFSYNGTAFTQFVLSTNGFIKLGATAPSAVNLFRCNVVGCTNVSPVTSTNAADVNLIMPFSFDLEPGTGAAEYRVATTGTAPNRVCTVQWKNVRDKSDATPSNTQYDNFSFQAKLYETSNSIEFVYGTATPSAATAVSRFPDVGIKGSGAANGQTVLGSKTTGAALWSTTTFITGNYTGSTHNFRNAAPPDAGRTYRFDVGTPVVATPPANDDCAGAITLTPAAACTATTGTTVGGTQSLAAIACGGFTGSADDDVWYKFVATATSHTVTVVGSASFDAVVDVRSGTCANSTNIGCADATLGGGTETATLSGLTVGSTYFVRVYTYDTATSTFTICVTGGGAAGTCAPVTNAVVTNTGSTATAATASLAFTAAAGATDYTLTLTPTGSTGTPATGTVTGSPVGLTGLTPNTSYTVTITTNCANGSTSSTVTVVFTSAAASTATPPANDDCAGAITLTPSATCTPTNGTTVGATQSLAAIACGGFTGTADDDVWYKFVATATSHTVTVVGNGTFDAVVDVRSGTCASSTNIGCADATTVGGTETATLTGLTVGSTYFVRVYTYDNGAADTFTICVTGAGTAPTCAAVTNAVVTTSGGTATTATASLTFTAAAGATNYTLTLAPTGSTGTPTTGTLTGSPVSLTGLTPNTSYTVTITTNCANGGTSSTVTVVFTSGPAVAPPANDNPTGAIALTVGTTCTPTTGTNVGATTTTVSGYTNPGTCGAAANPKDVWYSFTTLAGQTAATVTVTGAPAGLVRVFSAASNAGPFTQVSCAAGATNNTVAGPVSLTALTANTTYYVSVAGYGSGDTQGSFTICVTAPACLAPTSLTAGSITATGATLTFTAPASGATGYTVTYTAAGGTAQTQSATASPVTLTGLLSGKQYSVSIVTNCGGGQTSPAATTTFTTLAPAPTNATASSVTATGASIGFTAAAGATSYTVTYTAAGGSPITVTATSSPVVLTGLTGATVYTVTIVANYPGGGVSSPTTVTFTTPQATSVRANLAGGELAVYPNPAHQSFTVSLPAITTARTAQLMIVNALGQTVTSRTINLTAGGTRIAADATGLATGVYSVQVRVGSEIAVTRLVIE